jgi:medium-chain acyl-[acyl-carrier-protein] hydrolase
MSRSAGHWLGWHRPNPQAGLRLFCFPYGGGGAAAFRTWQDYFPATIEVCPVQIPGREERLNEPCFTSLISLVENIAEQLSGLFDKPFAFFGHSLGAMIAFELARQLRKEQVAQPIHVFASGRRAPQIPDSGPRIYDLPAHEFVAFLRQLNFVRQELLERTKLLELIAPILRADYEMVQTYSYVPEAPFDFPITAFGGAGDFVENGEALEAWRGQTRGPFTLHIFPGDHFFVHSSQPALLAVIARQLQTHF